MARTAKPTQPDCPHCRKGPQTFRYLKRQYVFDVDLARKLVRDGRAPVEVDESDVRHSVENTRVYPQHLPHVNVKYPGIIAHVWFPLPDGTDAHGHLLIDGNHRAARCLELQRPFYAYLLSEEESRRILLRRPFCPSA